MESTRTVEISRQNGRFLPQNRPFLQENRAIFSQFPVLFLLGETGILEFSGPQQIPARPKEICATSGQKSPAGKPAKWLSPPPGIPSDRSSSLGWKKKPPSSFFGGS